MLLAILRLSLTFSPKGHYSCNAQAQLDQIVLKRADTSVEFTFLCKIARGMRGSLSGRRECKDKQEKLQWVRRHTGVRNGVEGKRRTNEGREEKINNVQSVISFARSIN
jgi:hypothetical protein